MEAIDFVVTWVDGSDPAWLSQRETYLPEAAKGESGPIRYRDWDLMRYWFRGVEIYAPWVRRIFFITWGHIPPWLNICHPKLKVVRHEDFIPQKYLPTFNSNVIELNLHRIPELGEHFVLFNDDMFLLRPVGPEDFFHKGLPRDTARLGAVTARSGTDVFPHIVLNNCGVLNRHFQKQRVMARHWSKFFAPQYGPDLLRNLLLMPFSEFSCFYDTHLPTPHLKSSFLELWDREEALLAEVSTHRFRCREDVSHWLMKTWRFCKGEFYPRSSRWGRCLSIGGEKVVRAIQNRRYRMLCLNDNDADLLFEEEKYRLRTAFQTILPTPSSFECPERSQP